MNDRALRLWTLAASFAFTSGISAAATPALACGGGYGQDVALADSQIMALSFRDGVETYVFQPAFCGSSAAFGLVLPVPNVLQSDPSVVDDELFPALFELSKPTVEVVESCEPRRQ